MNLGLGVSIFMVSKWVGLRSSISGLEIGWGWRLVVILIVFIVLYYVREMK